MNEKELEKNYQTMEMINLEKGIRSSDQATSSGSSSSPSFLSSLAMKFPFFSSSQSPSFHNHDGSTNSQSPSSRLFSQSPSSRSSSSVNNPSMSEPTSTWNKLIFCDILWDYVYSKFLNTWLVVLAILYTLTLATSYLIPDIHWNTIIERWFMSVVSIIFIIFLGIFGTVIILPLSIANSPKGFHLWYNRLGIFFFPVVSAVLFSIFWIYKRDQSYEYFPFVSWLLSCLGCLGCWIYCCHILLRKNDAYVNRKMTANKNYVRQLLKQQQHSPQLENQENQENHKPSLSTKTIPNAFEKNTIIKTENNEVTNHLHSQENDKIEKSADCSPESISFYLHPIYQLDKENNRVINITSTIHKSLPNNNNNNNNNHSTTKDSTNEQQQKFPPHEPFVYPEHQTFINPVIEESTLGHFFKTFDWRRVLHEVRKDTPQLLMLGTLLGYVVVAVMLGYAFTIFWVTITWNDIWHVFQQLTDPIETFVVSMNNFVQSWNALKSEIPSWLRNETQRKLFENNTEAIDNLNHYLSEAGLNITYEDIKQFELIANNVTDSTEEVIWAYSQFYSWYDDFKNGFLSYKDEYEELRWSWNYSLLACAIIVTLVALGSLIWPILVSCNIRRNLRSGKWRTNKRAYVSNYQVHHLAYVPGMQFGTALMSFLLYLLLLSVVVFLLVYTPTRDLIWLLSRDFVFTLVMALILKEALVYFVFVKWQLDPEGNVKNIQTYSVSFCIFLIFNVLYGILASLFRMLIFIGYSFVAILRIDATMLPDEFREIDQGYYSFHSYLMFEHHTKNPILRAALEIFTESGKFHASRRLSSFCPTTTSTSSILSSCRARNRWFLAYTLISNPSIISLRRRNTSTTKPSSSNSSLSPSPSPSPSSEQ